MDSKVSPDVLSITQKVLRESVLAVGLRRLLGGYCSPAARARIISESESEHVTSRGTQRRSSKAALRLVCAQTRPNVMVSDIL